MADTPVHVLLIEDDEQDYLITRRLLQGEGGGRFRLSRISGLTADLDGLDSGIDALLLDLNLPESRGWDTFLQAKARFPGIPIILLTGLQDEELGSRAVDGGAQDYLVKDRLDSYPLVRSILYAIARKKIEDRLAQVVGELRRRHEEMADDVSMAREVQLALLPRQYPTLPAGVLPEQSAVRFAHIYQPCRSVGGDFLSIFPLGSHLAGVFLCDVMGHGVRSALVAAVLRGLLEELKPAGGDPGRLLTELNRGLAAVLRQPDQLLFASGVCLTVDAESGMLACANAGHPPPLALVRGRGQVESSAPHLEVVGPALGINGSSVYRATRWSAAPGDRVLLFTDGLSEITNANGAEFGRERIGRASQDHAGRPLGEWLRAILAEAEAFSGRTEFEDDVGMVGIEIVGLVSPALSAGDANRGGGI